MVRFGKGDRKIGVMRPYLAAAAPLRGGSRVAAIGVAQVFASVFTGAARDSPGGVPWFHFAAAGGSGTDCDRSRGVIEVREVLRCWLAGDGLRTAAERAGVDRKTARRYVEAAQAAGLVRGGGEGQLTDELIGAVIAAVRPARASGYGVAWETLLAHEQLIRDWVEKDDLQLTNIHGKLTRRGVVVPYRTLHRFATERCGFGRCQPTVRSPTANRGWSANSTSPASA